PPARPARPARRSSDLEPDLQSVPAIRNSLLSVYGPTGSETRKTNDIYEMVRGAATARIAALPYFYLDCGTEDLLVNFNQKFAVLDRKSTRLNSSHQVI